MGDIQLDDPNQAVQQRVSEMCEVFTPDSKYSTVCCGSSAADTQKNRKTKKKRHQSKRPPGQHEIPMHLRAMDICISNKTDKKWLGHMTQIELLCAVDVPHRAKSLDVFNLIWTTNTCDSVHVQKTPFPRK